jgi:heptosyltransferase II
MPSDRILVIHTAFIGDLVLAAGFFAALRKDHPKSEILFLTTKAGAEVYQPNPWNLRIEVYDKRKSDSGIDGFFRTAKKLRTFAPQITYCIHRSLRSALLAKIAGGYLVGFQESAGSFLFQKKVSRVNRLFEAEKNISLLEKSEKFYPKLYSSESDRASVKQLLQGKESFVVINPSSVWATKRWPAERYGELAWRLQSELGIESVIVGSAEDVEVVDRMLQSFKKLAKSADTLPLNLAGKTSLGQLKAVLEKSQLVISNDSSPLHIGLAMGKKAVAVFGPTTRSLGFFPYAPEGMAKAVEHSGLNCRPCGLHGHHKCPLHHFRCMLEIEVDQVFREVKDLCP